MTLSLTTGKCGTDALITYLNLSDSVVISNPRSDGTDEINFFDKAYHKGIQWCVVVVCRHGSQPGISLYCSTIKLAPVISELKYYLRLD